MLKGCSFYQPKEMNGRKVLVSPTNTFPASQKEKLTSDYSLFISFFFLPPTRKLPSFQVGTVRKVSASGSDKGLAGTGGEQCLHVQC